MENFIFLTGPSQSGKSSIAQVLLGTAAPCIIYHTYDTLRDALMHTIYGEPTFDEYSQGWKDTPLPVKYTGSHVISAPHTNRTWMEGYQGFLRAFHGNHIMGELAARNVKHFGYSSAGIVIIDSLRTNIEKNEFLSHFPNAIHTTMSVHRKGYNTFSVGERLEGNPSVNVMYDPLNDSIINL